MPQAGFYNSNLYRDYPFTTVTQPLGQWRVSSSSSSSLSSAFVAEVALPHSAIVDFGAIMGVALGYNDATDMIYLWQITRADPYIAFTFRCTASSELLSFVRRIDAPEYMSEWGISSESGIQWPVITFQSSSSSGSSWTGSRSSDGMDMDIDYAAYCRDPDYEGFLITGNLDELLDLVADGEVLEFTSVPVVEPGRVQNLSRSFVRGINIANRARTKGYPPERCWPTDESSDYQQDEDAYSTLDGICMQGAIHWAAGYNCHIRLDHGTNTLIISGIVGAGLGEPCSEYSYYPGEVLDPGETYYGLGPRCDELIKTINGVGGSRIRLEAGPGFRVATDSSESARLTVRMAPEDFTFCPSSAGGG